MMNILLSSVATELAEYQDKIVDASIYYKEAFGITPEKALENEEKIRKMEELVASLEAEVRQIRKDTILVNKFDSYFFDSSQINLSVFKIQKKMYEYST